MNVPKVPLQQIAPGLQDYFQRLQEYLRTESPLRGFRLIEITFNQATENYRYRHGLGSLPKDVIQTRLTGAGSLTWNYEKFDSNFLDITTTGPCVVRAFVGTYQENTGA